MAYIYRKEQFGNVKAITTEMSEASKLNDLAKQEMVRLVEQLATQVVEKGYVPFDLKTYVKTGGDMELYFGHTILGAKVNAVYVGEDWGYWKILTKRIITTWWSNLIFKLKGSRYD